MCNFAAPSGWPAELQSRNAATVSGKSDDYVRLNPNDTDLKRKAYTAVAAKMARVVYGLVKTNTDYRHFLQEAA